MFLINCYQFKVFRLQKFQARPKMTRIKLVTPKAPQREKISTHANMTSNPCPSPPQQPLTPPDSPARRHDHPDGGWLGRRSLRHPKVAAGGGTYERERERKRERELYHELSITEGLGLMLMSAPTPEEQCVCK